MKQRLAAGGWLAACLALSWPAGALGSDESPSPAAPAAAAEQVATPAGAGGDAPLAGTATAVGPQPRASALWLAGLAAIGFIALRRRSR